MAMFQKSEEAKRGPNAEEIKKATASVQRFEKPVTCSSVSTTAVDVRPHLLTVNHGLLKSYILLDFQHINGKGFFMEKS